MHFQIIQYKFEWHLTCPCCQPLKSISHVCQTTYLNCNIMVYKCYICPKLIEKQTEQMRIMGEDKKHVEAKLTEELNKVSESMRKELERACQVIIQLHYCVAELHIMSNINNCLGVIFFIFFSIPWAMFPLSWALARPRSS